MPAPNTNSTTLNTTSGLCVSSRPLRNAMSGAKAALGAWWPCFSSASATASAEVERVELVGRRVGRDIGMQNQNAHVRRPRARAASSSGWRLRNDVHDLADQLRDSETPSRSAMKHMSEYSGRRPASGLTSMKCGLPLRVAADVDAPAVAAAQRPPGAQARPRRPPWRRPASRRRCRPCLRQSSLFSKP